MSKRRETIQETIKMTEFSKTEFESTAREWTIAHDAYNNICTAQSGTRSRAISGASMENVRLHAIGAYEAMLDAMRIHAENIAHLKALTGK